MRRIKTKDLKPGMLFTKPVYIEEETIFIQPELPLKQQEIDRLLKWHIEEVLTEGTLIAESIKRSKELEEKVPEKGPSFAESLISKKSLEFHTATVAQLSSIFEDVGKKQRVVHDRIDTIVKNIITATDEDQNSVIQIILIGEMGIVGLSDISVKNAILSTIIGKNMKMLSFRLLQLTTGALLHDIGMLKVPEEIRLKKGKLVPEEIKQVRAHPVHGYTVVLKELQYPEEVAAIALLHQERWDGTGYPRRLKGEAIPLGARIVAVADAFVAMVNKRIYRDQMIGYKAMKSILSDNGKHFDPKVLKALLMSLGIYPVGSLVQMNNGAIGRVVETHSVAPLRPKIQLIIDEYGDKLIDEVFVDLLTQKDLFIAKAIDPKTIERMSSEQ